MMRCAGRVIAFRIVVVHADVVGREGAFVIGVGLLIGHRRREPENGPMASLEVAQQKFVPERIVAVRFREWDAVRRGIGQAHAEVVSLDPPIATPLFPGPPAWMPGSRPLAGSPATIYGSIGTLNW